MQSLCLHFPRRRLKPVKMREGKCQLKYIDNTNQTESKELNERTGVVGSDKPGKDYEDGRVKRREGVLFSSEGHDAKILIQDNMTIRQVKCVSHSAVKVRQMLTIMMMKVGILIHDVLNTQDKKNITHYSLIHFSCHEMVERRTRKTIDFLQSHACGTQIQYLQYISFVLTNDMMAANNKIFTRRSSNCSNTSCQIDFPSSTGSSFGPYFSVNLLTVQEIVLFRDLYQRSQQPLDTSCSVHFPWLVKGLEGTVMSLPLNQVCS